MSLINIKYNEFKDYQLFNSTMSSFYASDDDNILTIKTVQIAPFRALITALKDIILDTNVIFDAEGMKIINMDKTHTTLVNLLLEADKFEMYKIKKEKILIGVNVVHFSKLINMVENDDTLIISIEKNNYAEGFVSDLTLTYENASLKKIKRLHLRLLEPDIEELKYPEVPFSSIINFSSEEFQKIVRDYSAISDKIEIKSVGDELIFKCTGQISDALVVLTEVDQSMEYVKKPDTSKVIQGVFSLKNLGYFIRCTNLCKQIEMYLENDLPLIVKYDVARLGNIKLCLAQAPLESNIAYNVSGFSVKSST